MGGDISIQTVHWPFSGVRDRSASMKPKDRFGVKVRGKIAVGGSSGKPPKAFMP